MLISTLPDPTDGSSCTLILDEQNQWLHAIWRGFVDVGEATRGAENYLRQLQAHPCPYLLNDNTQLQGPWFDSLEWLQRTWAPEARQLGLRYVAHVTPHLRNELASVQLHQPFAGQFEIQLFENLPEAQDWLRTCQKVI